MTKCGAWIPEPARRIFVADARVRTISFCIVDKRAVFMDLRTDSYFSLNPVTEHHRLQELLDEAAPLSTNPDLLDMLGFADEAAKILRADYTAPAQSLIDQGPMRRASVLDVFKVANLVRTMRSRLRTRPLEAALGDVLAAGQRAIPGKSSGDEMIVRTGRFLDARRLVPFARNCLLDSLSLLCWLRSCRNTTALVFGVKLDPFAAHCWVQSDDLVVNDRVETVAAFTPVRVIRCSDAMR